MSNRKPVKWGRLENPYASNDYRTNRNDNGGNSSSSDSKEMTTEDLADLSFAAYLVIIRLLLASADYKIVRSLGRRYLRSNKPNGGADLIAAHPSRQGPIKVLVQVKQETRRLQRRYVDELRGKMLRAGVSHGLVITLGTASKPALEAANEFPGRPISFIEGKELAEFVGGSLGFSRTDLDIIQAVHFASNGPTVSHRRPLGSTSVASGIIACTESCDHDERANSTDQLAISVAFVTGLIVGMLLK